MNLSLHSSTDAGSKQHSSNRGGRLSIAWVLFSAAVCIAGWTSAAGAETVAPLDAELRQRAVDAIRRTLDGQQQWIKVHALLFYTSQIELRSIGAFTPLVRRRRY
ncbi:MAG: hypothetical protein GX594_17085 [Pirellulaceae bacterium]|nr:hypothetical protein [Pirellulaceae bacterium]